MRGQRKETLPKVAYCHRRSKRVVVKTLVRWELDALIPEPRSRPLGGDASGREAGTSLKSLVHESGFFASGTQCSGSGTRLLDDRTRNAHSWRSCDKHLRALTDKIPVVAVR